MEKLKRRLFKIKVKTAQPKYHEKLFKSFCIIWSLCCAVKGRKGVKKLKIIYK